MPSQSNIPTSGGARDNNAAAVDDAAIKDEADDDDGPIPFLVAGGGGGAPSADCGRTVHSVSPTNATPCKHEDEDDLTTVNSEKGATLRQPDLMRSNSNDNNNEKKKDILLSLKDEKYKKIYSQYCEKLWGENRDESLTTGDVGKRMLNKLKKHLKKTGGNLHRGSKGGNSASPASDKVALKSKYLCITICISSTTSKFTYNLPPFYSVH